MLNGEPLLGIHGGPVRLVTPGLFGTMRQKGSVDETSLDVQDFSATTDLYSVVANVYEMREFPFTLKDLIGPIGVPVFPSTRSLIPPTAEDYLGLLLK